MISKPQNRKAAIYSKIEAFFISFSMILLCFSANITKSYAQTEELASFDINSTSADFSVENYRVVDNQLLIILKSSWNKKEFKSVDLTTKEVKHLGELNPGASNIVLSDSGVFCITTQESAALRFYRINRIGLDGNVFGSFAFETTLDSDPQISFETSFYNGEYYVFRKDVDESEIWKSSGQQSSISTFLEPTNLIGQVVLEDTLILIEHYNYVLYLSKTTGTDPPVIYDSIPFVGISTFYNYIDTYNNKAYFAALTTNDTNTYQVDLTGINVFLDGLWLNKIDFGGDSFRFLSGGYADVNINRGSINNPSVVTSKKLVSAQNTDFDFSYISYNISWSYFTAASISQGVEIGFINSQDSIELVKDLLPGKGSPLPYNIDGFERSYGNSSQIMKGVNVSDTLYSVLTNGGDEHFYVYEIVDTNVRSLFKIDNVRDDMTFFKEGNFLYWFVKSENKSLKLMRRDLSDSDSPQPPMKTTSSEEWFRQMNLFFRTNPLLDTDRYIYPQKVRFDKENNIILEFAIAYYDDAETNSISPSNNKEIKKLKNVHVFAKYDKFGNLLWMNEVGGQYHFWQSANDFELDTDGNLIIVGGFYKKGYFDDLTVESERAVDFICKLNAETGNVMWQRNLFENFYTDHISFEGIALDELDNVYIPVLYRTGKAKTNSGEEISSIKGPAVATLKLDQEGNVKWFKNTPTPWFDTFGKTRVFNINNKTITSIQNQFYYGYSMSCAYQNINSFVQTLDLDGNVLDTFQLSGNDAMSITEATQLDDGSLFGTGFFRNTLSVGPFVNSSEPSGSCFAFEGYTFQYDNQFGQIACAATTVGNNVFHPVDLRQTSTHIYVLGTTKESNLQILKYNKRGEFIGLKNLNINSAQNINRFDVTDDFIILLGKNYKRNDELGIRPLVNFTRSASILKIKNEGWDISSNPFYTIQPKISELFADFVIYPNPFTNEINLTFDKKQVDFNSYQIHTVDGKFLLEGTLNYLQYQTINLSGLVSGVYSITLIGENKTETRKIVKF